MARSKYTQYRKVVGSLGLRQLDVYRIEKGRKEILRLQDKRSGKIIIAELPRPRDEMNLKEFEEYLKKLVSSR